MTPTPPLRFGFVLDKFSVSTFSFPSENKPQYIHLTGLSRRKTNAKSCRLGNQPTSVPISVTRHHLPAAAVSKKEAHERAATPTAELHHFQQPGAVWGGGAGGLLLGLQHHADQVLEDGRARGREARRPPPQGLHRLLRQQRQAAAELLGRLSGENERQHALIPRNAGGTLAEG